MLPSSQESIAAFERMLFDACALFRPPEKLSVADWADKYLFLSPEGSARPGKYYISTAEYQREPLECLSPGSGYDTVVQMWSSQTGKTQNALSLTGYHTHHDPAPILFLEPDENLAKAIAKDRIAPMIRDTPVLAPLFGKGKGSGNDTLYKSFPGGQIDIGWASSPTGMASRPKRVLITDEEDAYILAANKEGNPIGIAEARLATYSELGSSMHLRVSSPRNKRTSYIFGAFQASDQRHFYVPCPQCGHMQTLRWEQLRWPIVDGKADPKACYYVCEQSGCEILHRDKPRMVRRGKWIAHNPGGGNGRTAGFYLNALYSTIGFSWAKLIDKYLECEGIPDRLQVFTNTLLGLPWDEQSEGVDLNEVSKGSESYAAEAPDWVVLVTVGADVQKNRIEGTRWGWGLNEQSGALEHRVFHGDPEQPAVWQEFDAWRRRQVIHETGLSLPTAVTLIDSGDGNRTDAVYRYTRVRTREGVFACKGSSINGVPLANRPRAAGEKKTPLVMVGTSTAKDKIYARLGIQDKTRPGAIHFPDDPSSGCDAQYFAQLTAEKLVTRKTKSGEESRWECPEGRRNEALDCAVYNFAAYALLVALKGASMPHLHRLMQARIEKLRAAGRLPSADQLAELNAERRATNAQPWPGAHEPSASQASASVPASGSQKNAPRPPDSSAIRPKKRMKRVRLPNSGWIRG